MKNGKIEISEKELEKVNGGVQTEIRKDYYENIILYSSSSKSGGSFVGLVPEEERLPQN